MTTISAFKKDIEFQTKFIENFIPFKPISISRQKRTIICGTGDSFAAALLCEAFSDFRVRAFDPLDLLKNKRIVRGKELYLISISGNTLSNIKLARKAQMTIAVTSNPKSKLAKTCKKTIVLRYKNSGIFTSGSISFVASALTCISLVSKVKIKNAAKMLAKAQKVATGIRLSSRIFLLGNLYTFPIAMFGAAKLYEILGMDTSYERIEQFSHMGLFSTNRGDTIIIFEEKNSHNKKLLEHLKKCGLKVIRIQPPTKNKLEMALFFTFVIEYVAFYHAKRKNLNECYFVTAKKLRNASSSMIY